MCGIYGWVGRFARDLGLHHACLRHRGPDEAGTFRDAVAHPEGEVQVAFGHQRLKIIDLSPAAAQPMLTGHGTVIVYNGEVYNYRTLRLELEGKQVRFRSASDTEVVLRGYETWGLEVLPRLNGMFAFAIWDRRARRLVLARDPVGVKPLFYALLPHGVVFASEIKALLRTPGIDDALDPLGLADYFTVGYTVGERTVFRAIRKLLPGHVLVWRDGGIECRRYWSPPAVTAVSEADAVARLDELLRRAVERHLIADVPLGAFLSGGVDSSLIVALMRRVAGGPVRTFCVGFRGLGLYDERPFARQVARLFDTEHTEHEVVVRPLADIERIAGAFDEPFADSSAIPTYYLAETTRRHVTVALSGTGGDDLFGGYRRYASPTLRGALARLPAPVRQWLRRAVAALPQNRRSRLGQSALFARRALDARAADGRVWYADLMTLLDRELLMRVAPDLPPPVAHPLAPLLTAGPLDGGAGYLAADFFSYLPDDLLVKEDRMTMAHGLEARVPFLDREVVEFAWALPQSFKVRGLQTKVLLKRVALRWLPREIVFRPKHGFAVPVSEWFRGELRGLGLEVLLGGDLLDPRAVRDLWDRHQRGEADLGPQLWTLFAYRLWERVRPRTRAA
jgi:asparagine synthase (glutamine-hydrolysing)